MNKEITQIWWTSERGKRRFWEDLFEFLGIVEEREVFAEDGTNAFQEWGVSDNKGNTVVLVLLLVL